MRIAIFKLNLEFILQVNQQSADSVLAPNQFSHLTFEEFQATHLGYVSNGTKMGSTVQAPGSTNARVNWVEAGKVAPIKDQGEVRALGNCAQP